MIFVILTDTLSEKEKTCVTKKLTFLLTKFIKKNNLYKLGCAYDMIQSNLPDTPNLIASLWVTNPLDVSNNNSELPIELFNSFKVLILT